MRTQFVKLLLLWGVVIAGALALRLPQLDRRPMHTNESVHAIKFQGLWEKGAYAYDPNEFHGPSLYYATLPFAWLSGAGNFAELRESTLRLVPVAFGLGLILLLPLLADGLGFRPALLAGVLTAISPAMVFFSRYFIHEMLLVFFTLLVMAAAWRYRQSRHWKWAVLTRAWLGLDARHQGNLRPKLCRHGPVAGFGARLEPLPPEGAGQRQHLATAGSYCVGCGCRSGDFPDVLFLFLHQSVRAPRFRSHLFSPG